MQETLDPLDESNIFKEISKVYEKGVDLKQMAVLYRTGEDARVLAETFTQYQIPFSMKERIHHLYGTFCVYGYELLFPAGNWNLRPGRFPGDR